MGKFRQKFVLECKLNCPKSKELSNDCEIKLNQVFAAAFELFQRTVKINKYKILNDTINIKKIYNSKL